MQLQIPIGKSALMLGLGLALSAAVGMSAPAQAASAPWDPVLAEIDTTEGDIAQAQAAKPEAEAEAEQGSEPAETEDAAPTAETGDGVPPRVYWSDSRRYIPMPCGAMDDFYARPSIDDRLAAARSRLDDSAHFPPRGYGARMPCTRYGWAPRDGAHRARGIPECYVPVPDRHWYHNRNHYRWSQPYYRPRTYVRRHYPHRRHDRW